MRPTIFLQRNFPLRDAVRPVRTGPRTDVMAHCGGFVSGCCFGDALSADAGLTQSAAANLLIGWGFDAAVPRSLCLD